MRIILQTPRLTIREFLPEEVNIYLSHFDDEEVCLYIPRRTREERIGIFNKALANYSNGDPLQIWGMFKNENDEFIGSCLLRPFANEEGLTELGYSIDKKDWGKGYGTEMAKAMIEKAFLNVKTIAVVAVTDLANTGSQRVLEKAGMTKMNNLLRDADELAYFRIDK